MGLQVDNTMNRSGQSRYKRKGCWFDQQGVCFGVFSQICRLGTQFDAWWPAFKQVDHQEEGQSLERK